MRARDFGFLLTVLGWMVIAGACTDAVSQTNSPGDTTGSRISMMVIVADRDGQSVRDLRESDFTVFDDNVPQKLLAFRAGADRDAGANYVLTVRAAHSERANEFHSIAVRVERPNLEVRTIRGYYAHR